MLAQRRLEVLGADRDCRMLGGRLVRRQALAQQEHALIGLGLLRQALDQLHGSRRQRIPLTRRGQQAVGDKALEGSRPRSGRRDRKAHELGGGDDIRQRGRSPLGGDQGRQQQLRVGVVDGIHGDSPAGRVVKRAMMPEARRSGTKAFGGVPPGFRLRAELGERPSEASRAIPARHPTWIVARFDRGAEAPRMGNSIVPRNNRLLGFPRKLIDLDDYRSAKPTCPSPSSWHVRVQPSLPSSAATVS